MFRRLIPPLFAFLCGAVPCLAQVKLTPVALPATGQAGFALESLVGTGFPKGTVLPADVQVSIASSCNGSSLVSITPTSVTVVPSGAGTVSFKLPAALKAGQYALSVQGSSTSGISFTSTSCASLTVVPQKGFVTAKNGQLMLGGLPFKFAGGNEAGLKSDPHATTDQMLQTAASNQFNVIRVWTFIDIGTPGGSNSIAGPENGLYFQYWNGSEPAFNDGATGLQNLDYAVYQAGQHGFKLILTLTNNWSPGGGMDQYVRWAGDTYHDQFYTDPKIRLWYEAWISHLLNHVNPYSGVAYKDDPAIMNWELANEPRCSGTGTYPASPSCSTSTLSTWVGNESAYIHSIDHNHLVSVGDEGFFCTPNSSDPYNGCSGGDDAAAFAAAPGIDLVTFHLYTASSGTDNNYGLEYINQHIALGKSLDKPTYMGEFGLQSGNPRNAIYNAWLEDLFHNGGSGALVWDVGAGQPGPIAAESQQGLDLFDQAPLLQTLHNFAQEITVGKDLMFAPAADDQWATTTLNTATTLSPLQNVIAYGGSTVQSTSLDLDPSTAGQQSTVHPYGGQFTATNGSVTFTPDRDFNGTAVAPYTVRDSKGNLSNTAYLYATVQPTLNVSEVVESFETGADGWQLTGASTAQSTQFATDGPHSLKVVPTQTGWFGIFFSTPLNLANRPTLSLTMAVTGVSGESTDIVVQSGSNYLWCQSTAWPWVPANTVTNISVPLTAAGLGCSGQSPDFGQIDGIYVYLNAGATYYIDNVRAAAVPSNLLPISIASFETGTDGWQAQNGGGTVAQTTSFYTDGQYGLQINSTGDWFGSNALGTLDLSSKSELAFDIDTGSNAGDSVNVEIYSGSNTTPCMTTWGWASGSNVTATIPFNTLTGCNLDLTQIHGIYLWVSSGTFLIDNVRAQ